MTRPNYRLHARKHRKLATGQYRWAETSPKVSITFDRETFDKVRVLCMRNGRSFSHQVRTMVQIGLDEYEAVDGHIFDALQGEDQAGAPHRTTTCDICKSPPWDWHKPDCPLYRDPKGPINGQD